MKLLVFAHTPPPLHGQSIMVQTLLEGLRPDPAFEILHVNPQLSRDIADIGRWRIGKLWALLGACLQAWRLRWRHGPAVFYYVPAPGKRSALYRDFVVMALCRPFFPKLVLHWHASGLGEWLRQHGNALERFLAPRLLGRADLSIVLAPSLAADAEMLEPRRTAVVANCVPVPALLARQSPARNSVCHVVFIGLCDPTKGIDDLLEALALLERHTPGAFRLTLAGSFPNEEQKHALHAQISRLPQGLVEHVGFADEGRKSTLFAATDIFCFPTRYAHEAQPLVVIEALAHDVRIVTTRWRAIPEMLPREHVWLVQPRQPQALAAALREASTAPRPAGASRRLYESRFTPEQHVANLAAALLVLEQSSPSPIATAAAEKRA